MNKINAQRSELDRAPRKEHKSLGHSRGTDIWTGTRHAPVDATDKLTDTEGHLARAGEEPYHTSTTVDRGRGQIIKYFHRSMYDKVATCVVSAIAGFCGWKGNREAVLPPYREQFPLKMYDLAGRRSTMVYSPSKIMRNDLEKNEEVFS